MDVFSLVIPTLNQIIKMPFHFLTWLPLRAPARHFVIERSEIISTCMCRTRVLFVSCGLIYWVDDGLIDWNELMIGQLIDLKHVIIFLKCFCYALFLKGALTYTMQCHFVVTFGSVSMYYMS